MRVAHDQAGFTLVELLVATAVSGLLLALAVTITFQTTSVTMSSSADITASEDIKLAVRPFIRDLRMAQSSNLVDGADPIDQLILDWTSWYDESGELSAVEYHCEYVLLESEGKIERKLWKHYDSKHPGDPTSVSTHGKYISDIEFSRVGQLVTVTISSSPEDREETEETMSYQISMRVMEDPQQ